MKPSLTRREFVGFAALTASAAVLAACGSAAPSSSAPASTSPSGASSAAPSSAPPASSAAASSAPASASASASPAGSASAAPAASSASAAAASPGASGFKGASLSAQMAPELHAAPALLAYDLGFFKDQGLDVNMEVTHAQIDQMTALLAGGKLDWFTANTDASLNNALDRGAPIKVIAVGEVGKMGWHYTAMEYNDKLWQQGLRKPEDLKPGSQIDLTAGKQNTAGRKLWRFLDFHGFKNPFSDFNVKEWLNPAPVPQAFAAGQISTVFSGEPRARQLVDEAGAHVIGWDTDAPSIQGEPGTLLALNDSWLKVDPERGIRLNMAYLKGVQVYLDLVQSGWKDPKLRKIVADRAQVKETLFDHIGGPYVPPDGQSDLAKIDQAIAFFKTTLPVITGNLVPASKYVDFSYAKEAASRMNIKSGS